MGQGKTLHLLPKGLFLNLLPGEKGEGAMTVVALSPWGARKGGDPKGEWG